jgi:hypothetical protein
MMKPACPAREGCEDICTKRDLLLHDYSTQGNPSPASTRQNHLLFTNLQFVNDKCPGKSNLSALVGNKWHFLAGLLCGVQAPVK